MRGPYRGSGRICRTVKPPTRLLPYLLAMGGVALITIVVGLVRTRFEIPNLSLVYLVLVLWLGARYGSPAAVVASLLAFLSYNFFFVPPVGTFYVSKTADLMSLALLLAAALVTGSMAASLRTATAQASRNAREAGSLFELATSALREEDLGPALQLLCRRAEDQARVGGLSLVWVEDEVGQTIAGPPLPADLLRQAVWAHAHQVPVGIAFRNGRIELPRTHSSRRGPGVLPFSSGVAVLRLDDAAMSEESLRMLAALLALAELFMDRRRALVETERVRQLEASDQFKTAILSSVSHELKSPLATIRAGLTSLSMPESGLGEDQRELLGGLDRQAARLDRLVGDLLAMARLEAGVPPSLEPAAIDELLGAVLARLGPQLLPFRVAVELPPDLPPVLMDEMQIDRVITNLLVNAIDWTPPGGRISIGARPIDDGLQVWVENDGPSIPPEDLGRIFDKFWSRREGGSGLGLAICRRVIELHGGTLTAHNRRRRGPRFAFTLPAAAPAAVRESAAAEGAQGAEAT